MKVLLGCQADGRTGSGIQKWVSWNRKTTFGSLPKRQYFIKMIFKPPSAEIQAEYWRHLKRSVIFVFEISLSEKEQQLPGF